MNTEQQMPIGKVVQRSIPAILEYCETQDPTEFPVFKMRDIRRILSTLTTHFVSQLQKSGLIKVGASG